MKRMLATLLIPVLMATVILSGCTTTKKDGDTSKKAKEIKPTSISVDALWFASTAEGAKGGTSKVDIKLEKQSEKKLRVGFFEEEVAGTGDMWRAAGWAAALASSLLTGINLANYEISYTVEGRIDGPSAGALMTVGTLASLHGEKVKKDATMTGTINIDGSIGPVGGISQKLEGAKKAKKKLVLVPTGQRFAVDENTGQSVDVVDKGKDLGIDVKVVSNVFDAYEELVGKPLPKPEAKKVEMELPEKSVSKVKAKAKEWYSRYQEARSQYGSINQTLKSSFDPMVVELDALAQNADNYYTQGLFAASYGTATEAAMIMEMIIAAGKSGTAAINNAPRGEQAALQAAKNQASGFVSAGGRLDALFDRLKDEKPESLGDVLTIAGAYGVLLQGVGFEGIGGNLLENTSGDFQQQLTNAMMGNFYYAVVPLAVEASEDYLEMGEGEKKSKVDSERVKAMAEILRRAADANLNYFETTVIAEMAKAAGLSTDIYKEAFMNNELSYAFARALLNMMPDIAKKTGKGAPADYATLGAAMASYVYASELNAKYYSLGAKVDDNGTVVGVNNEKALLDMLDFNEERAEENIAIAAKAGGESPFPIIDYETARVAREKDAQSKLSALSDLWSANLMAQVMTMLSGQLELVPGSGESGNTAQYKWKDDPANIGLD